MFPVFLVGYYIENDFEFTEVYRTYSLNDAMDLRNKLALQRLKDNSPKRYQVQSIITDKPIQYKA